ncbi:helix-turn-helix transcriptional regulator [Pleurocapsales cyanobacterium LEGE 10410]|nr:helix-turn-helix transcriptional regulator [Pleurocapsales cyanobacterium LEGE 10410]
MRNLTELYSSDLEHEHLLDSDRVGWEKLGLVYELEPAGEMPEAVAPNHILVVCQGEFQASFQINGQWHHEQYTQGDVALFAAGELFPRVKTDRKVPLIDLFLPPDILFDAMGETASKIQLRSHFKFHDPLIQQMALALKTELELADEDSKLYADSMATALGAHLLRRYTVKKSIIKEYKGGLPSYQSKKVVEYIQENLDQNLSLSLLASLVHISPHYFASLFKQSTGTSPHKYITNSRLEKAKTLLHQRDLPLALICQEVGFKNQSHFTRVFRQHFHITPKAYRDLF